MACPVSSPDVLLLNDAPADDAPSAPLPGAGFAAISALALAACGEGSGTSTTVAATADAPSAPPPVNAQVIETLGQASRFLGQATLGATKAEIVAVQSSGYAAWLDAQFAMPRPTTFWGWLNAKGYNVVANKDITNGFSQVTWSQVISSPDQLRQRVGLALLDYLVVSAEGLMAISYQQFAAAAYLDVLWDGAFGNFRDLIEKVSTNVAMGTYLTFRGNRKANPNTGAQPDENYARELMQLFTIGLIKLNQDGTAQLVNGQPVESYTPADVSGLARVFTGWDFDRYTYATPDGLERPMIQVASNHETGVKSFLGTTIPAGTDGVTSLRLALDAIFAHQNVPPFFAKHMIQRLVTSNPSPAFVKRVADVFSNNGSGVRGDMKAVIRAILLDPEARARKPLDEMTTGKLREPVIRLVNWARAFGVTSPSDAWGFGDTSSTSNRLGQSIGRSPSVFNFFRPGYSPPNTAIATAGLVAPEFQITTDTTVIAYVNYMQSLIQNGAGDARANYTDILTKAADSQALVDEVNLVLAGNSLSGTTLVAIKAAVDAISATTTNGPANRVYTAILLTMASTDYLVQK